MFGFFRDPHDIIEERNRHDEEMARLGCHPSTWEWKSGPAILLRDKKGRVRVLDLYERSPDMSQPQRPPAMRPDEV